MNCLYFYVVTNRQYGCIFKMNPSVVQIKNPTQKSGGLLNIAYRNWVVLPI